MLVKRFHEKEEDENRLFLLSFFFFLKFTSIFILSPWHCKDHTTDGLYEKVYFN